MDTETKKTLMGVIESLQDGVERWVETAAHIETLQTAILSLIASHPDRAAFLADFSGRYEAAHQVLIDSRSPIANYMDSKAQDIHRVARG